MSEFRSFPDHRGRFGQFGGSYVPETLMQPVAHTLQAYREIAGSKEFKEELTHFLKTYVGRPTPLTFASRLSRSLGGAKIYLKREDLAHTGAHKINNALGQALLAKHMGKKRVIAETGAGQHGVATASAAALLGLDCTIYMGAIDIERQSLNVARMRMLGATVKPVTTGSKTLKDAISEAMREWVSDPHGSYYLIGSVLGPHPYPMMVRDFQAVIGHEARSQIIEQEGRLPDELIACVGGGSNSIGLITAFLDDDDVAMTGIEAGGIGTTTGRHAARFASGTCGVLHGCMTYLLQDDAGQIQETYSISAGLDYPSVGPEHAHLHDKKRVMYSSATDAAALAAFHMLASQEGILPALESSHALAYAMDRAPKLTTQHILLVNLSGRGDKDVEQILRLESHHDAR